MKTKLIDGLREMIFAMYTVLDEGVFDDSAQTREVGQEAIDRANALIIQAGHEPTTEEEWRQARDDK